MNNQSLILWAEQKGFPKKAIANADPELLMLLRLASNCLRQPQFLLPEQKKVFNNLLHHFRKGIHINDKQIKNAIRQARRLQKFKNDK